MVKRDGLVTTMERRGISSGIALRHLSCPWLHVRSARTTLEKRLPSDAQAPGVGLARQSGLKVPGDPHISPHSNNTWGSLGINNCGGQSVDFLLDPGATFSVLTEAPGLLSSWSTTIMGLTGWTKCYYFSHPSSRNWDSAVFLVNFWLCWNLPHPFWGGYTEQDRGLCFHKYETHSF